MTIECNPLNMRCFRCNKNKECDVLKEMKNIVSTYSNDKTITLRIEVPRCTASFDQSASKLDDFFKV
jgi:hypothetical protein